jgi:AcrR family transcriptional regulator
METGMVATRRGTLTRQRILEAAVRLVDAEGLSALSMRRLGRELGVEGMSLYRHLPSKDALLDGLVEIMLAEIDLQPAAGDWRARLRAVMRETRRVGLLHPEIFMLFATRSLPPAVTQGRGAADIDTFVAAGFDQPTAQAGLRTLVRYVVGYVLAETLHAFSPGATAVLEQAFTAPVADEPGAGSTSSTETTGADKTLTATFEFGLDVILDGLQLRLAGG